MRGLHSILLATDLFQTGKEVLLVAARLAQLFGARVHLLNVVKRHTDLHVADFPISQRATDQLQEFKIQLTGVGVNMVALPVEFGEPAEVIRRHAEALDIDLIVIGTGPHPAESTESVSPVAEAVIQRARQPVLAVYPGATAAAFKKMLCPVDHSTTSRRGLRNAIRLAQVFESELVVLSVIPDVSWLAAAVEAGALRNAMAEHERRWREEFNHFLNETDFGNVSWRRVSRLGKPEEQIVSVAADENVGLIVMGATGRTGLIRVLLGSVTRGVLRRLPCSILTVKDANLIDEFTDEDAKIIELLFVEAEALMEARSYEAAIAKFDQLLAHNPFHVDALLGRAEALELLGQPERAARSRQRAAALQRAMAGRAASVVA